MNLDQYQAWANQGMLKQGEALEIIALVRRQESELAAERDTNNRLTAAIEQSQASYGALAMELAAAKANSAPAPATPAAFMDSELALDRLIDQISLVDETDTMATRDARRAIHDHTARAVAAERDRCAKLATQWGMARMPEGGGNALFNFAEAVRRGVPVDERDTDYHWSKSPVFNAAAPQQHAQAALNHGWRIRKDDDGVIVVQKDGIGGYAATSDDDNIASSILHALVSDIIASHQPAAAPKIAMWLEADETARDADPYDIVRKDSMFYSTRFVVDEPTGNNPRWPMYFVAPSPVQREVKS